jgi:PAS domain-containing protein
MVVGKKRGIVVDLRRAAFELADAAIAVLDGEGRLADANPTFCATVGRARDEVLGTLPDWLEIAPDGRGACVLPDGRLHRVRASRRPIGPDASSGWVLSLERLGEPALPCPIPQACHYPSSTTPTRRAPTSTPPTGPLLT